MSLNEIAMERDDISLVASEKAHDLAGLNQ